MKKNSFILCYLWTYFIVLKSDGAVLWVFHLQKMVIAKLQKENGFEMQRMRYEFYLWARSEKSQEIK